MGHTMSGDLVRCPICGLGRLPAAAEPSGQPGTAEQGEQPTALPVPVPSVSAGGTSRPHRARPTLVGLVAGLVLASVAGGTAYALMGHGSKQAEPSCVGVSACRVPSGLDASAAAAVTVDEQVRQATTTDAGYCVSDLNAAWRRIYGLRPTDFPAQFARVAMGEAGAAMAGRPGMADAAFAYNGELSLAAGRVQARMVNGGLWKDGSLPADDAFSEFTNLVPTVCNSIFGAPAPTAPTPAPTQAIDPQWATRPHPDLSCDIPGAAPGVSVEQVLTTPIREHTLTFVSVGCNANHLDIVEIYDGTGTTARNIGTLLTNFDSAQHVHLTAVQDGVVVSGTTCCAGRTFAKTFVLQDDGSFKLVRSQ